MILFAATEVTAGGKIVQKIECVRTWVVQFSEVGHETDMKTKCIIWHYFLTVKSLMTQLNA